MTHHAPLKPGKFQDPDVTADGSQRAEVVLTGLRTLWVNTGTLCNIECLNCYIESSPTNDRLVYLTRAEVAAALDDAAGAPLEEMGITGGEPFMAPEIIGILEEGLSRGLRVLVLTNAMQPMMRPRVRTGLEDLASRYGGLTLRISLDHHSAASHDAERGAGAFERTLAGMRWLRDSGISMAIAGRTIWGEAEADARAGYARLCAEEGFEIDCSDPAQCVLFPEMDEAADVPEVTTECWGILDTSPDSLMCASARMLVRRKGAARPSWLACTLIPYDPAFELGDTFAAAQVSVKLNHPHCARFCVLGGASCSG